MKTQWKQLFYDGELVESAEIDNLKLKINLKDKYKNKINYNSINQMFMLLCKNKPKLREKFIVPSVNSDLPFLRLKAGHGYHNGASALAELRSYAKPLNRKQPLKITTTVTKEEFTVEVKIEKPPVSEQPTDTIANVSQNDDDDIEFDFDFFDEEINLDIPPGMKIPSFNHLDLLEFNIQKSNPIIFSPGLSRANNVQASTKQAESPVPVNGEVKLVPKLYFKVTRK